MRFTPWWLLLAVLLLSGCEPAPEPNAPSRHLYAYPAHGVVTVWREHLDGSGSVLVGTVTPSDSGGCLIKLTERTHDGDDVGALVDACTERAVNEQLCCFETSTGECAAPYGAKDEAGATPPRSP